MSEINVPAESLPQMPAADALSTTDLMYILQGSGLNRDRAVALGTFLADVLFKNSIDNESEYHWPLISSWATYDYTRAGIAALRADIESQGLSFGGRKGQAGGPPSGRWFDSWLFSQAMSRCKQINVSGTSTTTSTGDWDADVVVTIDAAHTGSSLTITGLYPHSAMCIIRNKSETSIIINWGAQITSYFLQPRATMLFFFKADATLENTPEQLFDLTGTKAILSAASLTTTGNIHTDSALQGGSASITGSMSSGAATVTGKTTTGSFESNGAAKVDGTLQVVEALQVVGITTALAEVKANGGVTKNGTPLIPTLKVSGTSEINLVTNYADYGVFNLGDFVMVSNDGSSSINVLYENGDGAGTKTTPIASRFFRLFSCVMKDGDQPILYPLQGN